MSFPHTPSQDSCPFIQTSTNMSLYLIIKPSHYLSHTWDISYIWSFELCWSEARRTCGYAPAHSSCSSLDPAIPNSLSLIATPAEDPRTTPLGLLGFSSSSTMPLETRQWTCCSICQRIPGRSALQGQGQRGCWRRNPGWGRGQRGSREFCPRSGWWRGGGTVGNQTGELDAREIEVEEVLAGEEGAGNVAKVLIGREGFWELKKAH